MYPQGKEVQDQRFDHDGGVYLLCESDHQQNEVQDQAGAKKAGELLSYRIIQGDVLERLQDLDDESVHCVVTSPPYWGLRDYGTGKWIDGDENCDHEPLSGSQGSTGLRADRRHTQKRIFSAECRKCGAIRLDQQIGLEQTPDDYLERMVEVFREIRRVLRSDGTCWVNMGDGYAHSGTGGNGLTGGLDKSTLQGVMPPPGTTPVRKAMPPGLKPKDLIGMPWRLAFALQADGWWLRQDIIWSKPNPMPESVTDRCTKSHEYIFLLTKSDRYFYDAEAIKTPTSAKTLTVNTTPIKGDGTGSTGENLNKWMQENGGRKHPPTSNKRSVWTIATEAFPEAHFATFPTKLVEPCILAGTSESGCCAKCGSPRNRVLEKFDTGKTQKMADGWDTGEGGHGTIHRDGRESGEAGKPILGVTTVGWEASCECDAGVIRCTVLDPFNGAGTTGVVATRLNREYVGIELNPEYREMALRRIREDNPMFNVEVVG